MSDRRTILLRTSSMFGALLRQRASRNGSLPIRAGLASAVGAPVIASADDDRTIPPEGPSSDQGDTRSGSMVKSLGEQVSMGGALGFAAGYSIRKVGNAVLFLVGTEVVILQYMAYREWLTMDWRRLGRDLAPKFSNSTWEGLLEILVYKMPFSAAFSGGLVAGLRLSSKK